MKDEASEVKGRNRQIGHFGGERLNGEARCYLLSPFEAQAGRLFTGWQDVRRYVLKNGERVAGGNGKWATIQAMQLGARVHAESAEDGGMQVLRTAG